MKRLTKTFNKNGMLYTILERSENYYFASLVLQERPESKRPEYESGRIVKRPDREIKGAKIQAGESIIDNKQFGQHLSEITSKDRDKVYFIFRKFANIDR